MSYIYTYTYELYETYDITNCSVFLFIFLPKVSNMLIVVFDDNADMYIAIALAQLSF